MPVLLENGALDGDFLYFLVCGSIANQYTARFFRLASKKIVKVGVPAGSFEEFYGDRN